MKGLKGNEQSILLMINDSFKSIQATLDAGDTVLIQELEQLRAMRDILKANREILNPYFRELISLIEDYILIGATIIKNNNK